MKRHVLIFGLILGTIMAIHVVTMMNIVYNNPNIESNDVIGYAAMIVVFSLIFFGIRNYRNKELKGIISFGHAFKTGALIALIGATMYVVFGLAYYYLFVPDFFDKYIMHVINQAARHGATEAELAEKAQELAQLKELHQNPLFVVFISYAEVLPIGLIVAVVASLILKKKPQAVTAS